MGIIRMQEELAGYEKNPKLKLRVEALEYELREYRKKVREQNNLEKQIAIKN
jgi:hypothetical protein